MPKMTKLQAIRKSLMDQLSKIESGDANAEDVSNIIGISDSMVKTYNVELRTRELELRAKEVGKEVGSVDVFEKMQ
jgi:predicted transcriptional regulator